MHPLVPQYLPGPANLFNTDSSGNVYSYQKPSPTPNWMWVCPGDFNRGGSTTDTSDTSDTSERPYWWVDGSSYLYPGPTAYQTGDNAVDPTVTLLPRKMLLWRNHKRDILLADYWFDFHSGMKVAHDFVTNAIDPPAWVDQESVRTINILFLDGHVKSASSAERGHQSYTSPDGYMGYTINYDNPWNYDPNAR